MEYCHFNFKNTINIYCLVDFINKISNFIEKKWELLIFHFSTISELFSYLLINIIPYFTLFKSHFLIF